MNDEQPDVEVDVDGKEWGGTATPEERQALYEARVQHQNWTIALGRRGGLYQGDVSRSVVAKRRAKNRAARKQRAINRRSR